MMLMKKPRLALLSVMAAALLAACGGGSDPQEPQSVLLESEADSFGTPQSATLTPALQAASDDGRKVARKTAPKFANKLYIVQLKEPPAISYTGGINNLPATKAAKGRKINRKAPAVVNYVGYLNSRHDAVLASVGGARKVYDYSYAFNGFAAELTEAQAQKLRTTKGVRSVAKDTLRQVHTASTSTFVGLAGPTGVWATTGARGEDVVIGIIDSGITPESNSFADKVNGEGKPDHAGATSAYNAPADWSGTCIAGTDFTTDNCNNKLIGARYFNAAWGGNAAISTYFPYEYLSPRDWGGHGTHTSSTAGGNANVTITGPAAGMGTISGMAPRARIATYKVCWSTTELGGGCFGSDSLTAIEAAIADGVDVINFSVGGSQDTFLDYTEIAFLEAAANGVFVAASAGNDGPDASTVEHPSPWVTTVAAGTHNRTGTGSVTVNGVTYNGASFAVAASGTLITAADAAMAGADADKVRLCYAAADNGGTAVLDPTKVAGKVVLCERGVTARVNKSLAVSEAGGAGMVLVNTSANSTNADLHYVPTVHLDVAAHDALFAAAATNPTASIAQSTMLFNVPAPQMAVFSSRGPTLAAGGNLLKPDIVAPGQDILAAVAPPGHGGLSFDLLSGTSMASPHIAGIAAVFKQLHPDWSPMMIKSALMTTAGKVLDGVGTDPNIAFAQGAGHVNPKGALDPGLVFDSGPGEWVRMLCGLGEFFGDCTGVPPLNPSDVNVPSVALGGLAGTQTVTRRVTNVSGTTATYTAKLEGMKGIKVTMSPSKLRVAPGQTVQFTLAFSRSSAALQTYSAGRLVMTDGRHIVGVPVVAQPVALAVPTEANGTYPARFGVTTTALKAVPRGLIPATKTPGTVLQDGTLEIPVTVPAGTTFVRFALFDSDINVADTDLDLEIDFNGETIGGSGGVTAEERVDFVNPAPGVYTVRIVGYYTPGGSSGFNLHSWVLGTASAGNMTATLPKKIVAGTNGNVVIGTTGLTPGTKYLGSVAYTGMASLPAPTIITIDP